MNERIRELSVIAKNLTTDDAIHLSRIHNRTLSLDELEEIFAEKFAELIVWECADRVAGSVVRDKGHVPQDPHSQGWNEAVAYASRELKKYFGVE